MIISTAPCRISLFGGGTDTEPYASKYGGVVLNMAINLRQKICLDGIMTPDTIENYSIPKQAGPTFYNAFFKEFEYYPQYLDALCDGEITGGIGSSASAAVALVGALQRLKNLKLTKDAIAEVAWDIEVNDLKMFGGKQDQYSAVYGGVNVMRFDKKGVEVIQLGQTFLERILPSLVLFHTGFNRSSGKIQEGLKHLTTEQTQSLHYLKSMAIRSVNLIADGDIKGVGKLMDEAWWYKKKSNKGVSNEKIDEIYDKAKKLGALGGKVCGSGGGGYMLFIVEPKNKEKLIKKLGIKWVDFDISWDGLQTRYI